LRVSPFRSLSLSLSLDALFLWHSQSAHFYRHTLIQRNRRLLHRYLDKPAYRSNRPTTDQSGIDSPPSFSLVFGTFTFTSTPNTTLTQRVTTLHVQRPPHLSLTKPTQNGTNGHPPLQIRAPPPRETLHPPRKAHHFRLRRPVHRRRIRLPNHDRNLVVVRSRHTRDRDAAFVLAYQRLVGVFFAEHELQLQCQ